MQQPHVFTNQTAASDAATRNQVLRNTYMLLAITMLPTILGAFIGVKTNLMVNLLSGMPWWMALLTLLVPIYGLMWLVVKNKNSGAGVAFLLAFTFVMGLVLSLTLQVALGFSNGVQLIAMAAGGTAAIFFSLATVATVSKKDFSFMGNFLFIGLVLLILAAVANIFLQMPAFSLAISAFTVLLFSGYILYDINRIVQGGETNYIVATLSVYVDVYNVFVSLLRLLMALAGNRD